MGRSNLSTNRRSFFEISSCYLLNKFFGNIICLALIAVFAPFAQADNSSLSVAGETVFKPLADVNCFNCHSGVPANHHRYLYGQPVQTGSVVPYPDSDNDCKPDKTYSCLSCHGPTLEVVADCNACHKSGSHHNIPNLECLSCHGQSVSSTDKNQLISSKSLIEIASAVRKSNVLSLNQRINSLESGGIADCNQNGVADECDISSGTSKDENKSGVPDECEVRLQTDCAGVSGGSAKADRCGVCNGDGESYLGCSKSDLTPVIAALSSSLKKEKRYFDRMASLAKAAGWNVNKQKRAVQKYWIETRKIIASYPVSAKSCTNTNYCADSALIIDTPGYNRNARGIYDLTRKIISKPVNTIESKRNGKLSTLRVLKRLYLTCLESSGKMPLTKSTC